MPDRPFHNSWAAKWVARRSRTKQILPIVWKKNVERPVGLDVSAFFRYIGDNILMSAKVLEIRARRDLSQFLSLKIRGSTNFMYFRNVVRRILKLLNCEKGLVGRCADTENELFFFFFLKLKQTGLINFTWNQRTSRDLFFVLLGCVLSSWMV